MDHGSDCRIFQQKKVSEIVKQLFQEHEIENVIWDIDDSGHQTREYCVQYRESDLAFVERILSEEGMFYYFEHGKEGELKLIVSDNPADPQACPGQEDLEYNALSSGAVKGVYCSSLNYREKLRATTMVQRDYTFKNPAYDQEHKERTPNPNGEKQDYELYDYPSRYKQDAVGKPFTTARSGAPENALKLEALLIQDTIDKALDKALENINKTVAIVKLLAELFISDSENGQEFRKCGFGNFDTTDALKKVGYKAGNMAKRIVASSLLSFLIRRYSPPVVGPLAIGAAVYCALYGAAVRLTIDLKLKYGHTAWVTTFTIMESIITGTSNAVFAGLEVDSNTYITRMIEVCNKGTDLKDKEDIEGFIRNLKKFGNN